MKTGTKRKLAAILAADIVAYSRLMEADEAGTLALMKSHRRDLWDPTIELHEGRVVGTAGDSLLVEFSSAVGAVECAIAVQQGMVERNQDVPQTQRMQLRVGINIGEVILDGDDIFGDGVNLAARLETICEPSGIAISDNVYDQVRGKVDASFTDAGQHDVKNISRPIQVWRWSDDVSPDLGKSINQNIESRNLNRPSIAILPFKNLSGDPEQEYFADGVAEDIMTALSRYRWLTMVSRNSSFAFRGEKAPTQKIAQQLGARYLLEGSIRRSGNRVRVTAQLVDATGDNQIWAENYDGQLDDIFDLQDNITRRVSASLKPELEKAEWERLRTNRTTDLNAWELYLRGIWHFYKKTPEDIEAAANLLEQSVAVDEDFGQAHAALAYVKFYMVTDGYTETPEETLHEAFRLAQKAISLDDQDAFAHFVLGRVYSIKFDYDQAISELELAIKLNPSLADAYHGLAFTFTYSGQPEKAIPLFETAYSLSPHDANAWAFFGIRAAAYIELERYDDAIRCAREAVQKRYPKYWAFSHLSSALGHGGKPEEAGKAVAELVARKPGFTVSFAREHLYYYREKEKLEHYLDGLRKAGVPE